MTFLLLVLLILQPAISLANQGDKRVLPPRSNRIDPSEVADALFPKMRIPSDDLYYIRLMLRFSHPDMQIVITQRTGGKFEVKRYTLEHGTTIGDAIKTAFKDIPDPTVTDVARRIHVREAALQVPDSTIKAWLTQLRALKISPNLDTFVCVDFCPKFDLWFDTGQDSVHYRFLTAGNLAGTAQTRLSKWMLKVRADLDRAPVILPQPRRVKPLTHR